MGRRRIGIICSDPYATDCSTDDEESIQVKNSTNANLIVRKFSNSIPANSQAQLQSGAGNFIGMVPDVSSPAAVDSPDPCAKKKYTGIRQRMSGRWTAEIRCPSAKKRLFMGSFSTAEEAADAYRKKRSEIDAATSIAKRQKEEKVAQEKKKEPDEHFFEKKYRVVRQRKSGRSTSEIRCPFTRGKKNDPDELCEKKYIGVRQRKSGRWTSEIRCPFTQRKSVHLGTFNTAEEAADAYNKKRCEFDMLISHKKKKVQAEVETKKVGAILKEPGNTYNEEKCKVKVQTGKDSSSPFTFSNENSTSVLSSQGGEGSNISICKEIPDLFLPTEKEFGIGIIDSHGGLIGEYSRMDDDLWLCRPGDDDEYM